MLSSSCSVNWKGAILTYDTRTNLSFFRSFSAADYVAAQRLRGDMFLKLATLKQSNLVMNYFHSIVGM